MNWCVVVLRADNIDNLTRRENSKFQKFSLQNFLNLKFLTFSKSTYFTFSENKYELLFYATEEDRMLFLDVFFFSSLQSSGLVYRTCHDRFTEYLYNYNIYPMSILYYLHFILHLKRTVFEYQISCRYPIGLLRLSISLPS